MAFDTIRIAVLNQKEIRVIFKQPKKVNSALLNPATYTVSPVDPPAASAVTVKAVHPATANLTSYIDLEITKPQFGAKYQVSASGLYLETGGYSLSAIAEFIGRLTKTDSLVGSMPRQYTSARDSNLRQILQAFGVEDERIGGKTDLTARTVTIPSSNWGTFMWGTGNWGG